MNTEQLIANLKNTEPNGLQVSIRKGFLNFTRAIFLKNNRVYIFDFEENWTFDIKYGYSKEEFILNNNSCIWKIEDTIY